MVYFRRVHTEIQRDSRKVAKDAKKREREKEAKTENCRPAVMLRPQAGESLCCHHPERPFALAQGDNLVVSSLSFAFFL
jgi:hypothetical protein